MTVEKANRKMEEEKRLPKRRCINPCIQIGRNAGHMFSKAEREHIIEIGRRGGEGSLVAKEATIISRQFLTILLLFFLCDFKNNDNQVCSISKPEGKKSWPTF